MAGSPSVSVYVTLGLLNLHSGTDLVTVNYSSPDTTTICSTNFCPPTIWTSNAVLTAPDWSESAVGLLLGTAQSATAFENGDFAFIEKNRFRLRFQLQVSAQRLPLLCHLPCALLLLP